MQLSLTSPLLPTPDRSRPVLQAVPTVWPSITSFSALKKNSVLPPLTVMAKDQTCRINRPSYLQIKSPHLKLRCGDFIWYSSVSVYAESVGSVVKESYNWAAAASPALMLASAVCAPVFFGVKKTRSPKRSVKGVGARRTHVGEVFKVGTSLKSFGKSGFVHHFLAGGVYKYAAFLA